MFIGVWVCTSTSWQDHRRSFIFLLGAPHDQWYPVFIFWHSHDIHHRPFESHAYELTENHNAKLSILLAKAGGGYTPECACSMLLVGQVCFAPCQIPYTLSSVKDQYSLVMLPQQCFWIGTCLMERMHSASMQNRPKGLPYLSLYDKLDISGFGASVVTLKHQCFAFLTSTGHWQNTVLKIISEVGCLFQFTANNLGASLSVVWHCLSDVLCNQ